MSKALYILAGLSDRDFEWLFAAGRRKEISAGTTLIFEKEPINALYMVLDGKLGVFVEALSGEEIAELTSGDVVGEMSFLDSRPPSATVKAIEDSVVWTIPRSQLAVKLSQDTAFAAHFYQAIATSLSDRLRGTVSRLGYGREATVSADATPAEDVESDLSPEFLNRLELAKTRLDWLLKRSRDVR